MVIPAWRFGRWRERSAQRQWARSAAMRTRILASRELLSNPATGGDWRSVFRHRCTLLYTLPCICELTNLCLPALWWLLLFVGFGLVGAVPMQPAASMADCGYMLVVRKRLSGEEPHGLCNPFNDFIISGLRVSKVKRPTKPASTPSPSSSLTKTSPTLSNSSTSATTTTIPPTPKHASSSTTSSAASGPSAASTTPRLNRGYTRTTTNSALRRSTPLDIPRPATRTPSPKSSTASMPPAAPATAPSWPSKNSRPKPPPPPHPPRSSNPPPPQSIAQP